MPDDCKMQRVTERVLCSLELLDLIFTHTDSATDAICARVNKNFFEASTKQLWQKLGTLNTIFSVLASIVKQTDGSFKFSHIPTPKDWDRFYLYSQKIRHLVIEENLSGLSRVFQIVSCGRTQVYLFPKLLTLKVAVSPSLATYAALFVHQDLSELVLRLKFQDSLSSVTTFLAGINERVENLKKFVVMGNVRTQVIEEALSRFLMRQKQLRTVMLPLFTTTSEILSSLALMPKLERIEFDYPEEYGRADTADVLEINSNLPNGAFPALEYFDFAASIKGMKQLFSMRYAPTNITNLYFHATDLGNISLLTECFKVIGDTCGNLADLTLVMNREITIATIKQAPPLSFDLFRPLLQIRSITSFFLEYPKALQWTSEDMEIVAKSWNRIGYLFLNPLPESFDEPLIDLSCLQIFLEHCPELYHLALFVDARRISNVNVGPRMFRKLRFLQLGASPLADSEKVAIFLGRLCAASCVLQVELEWGNSNILDKGYLDSVQKYKKIWDEVKKLLPVVTKSREEDRGIITKLQEENEKLRLELQKERVDDETQKLSSLSKRTSH